MTDSGVRRSTSLILGMVPQRYHFIVEAQRVVAVAIIVEAVVVKGGAIQGWIHAETLGPLSEDIIVVVNGGAIQGWIHPETSLILT